MENAGSVFVFDEAYVNPRCDFCGETYKSLGVQVSFGHGPYEICPACILKGPRVVAEETAARPKEQFHRAIRRWHAIVQAFAKGLEEIADFRELPGGILAVKIAEGYIEEHERGYRRK